VSKRGIYNRDKDGNHPHNACMEMVAQTARMNGEVHKTSGLRISLNWLEAGREETPEEIMATIRKDLDQAERREDLS